MFEVVLLALGLAMDAVAVALVSGSVGQRHVLRAAEVGLAFGLAQGIMPLLGWGLGVAFAGMIEAYDHWVAFALLGALGARMLWHAGAGGEDADEVGRRGLGALLTAALATSIDAGAAGLALPTLEAPIAVSCLVIGAVTGVLCMTAYLLGARVPAGSRKGAEILGGLVLIGLGVRIVIEHTLG